MIAGIMQPYFFPYLGYFDLIFRSDVWVVFDLVNFQPKTWMTRNCILHPREGRQYINCRISGNSQNMLIWKAQLIDPVGDRTKILGQLAHYKKHAPYYAEVIRLVERAFDERKNDTLTALNVSAMKVICDYLMIPFAPVIASEQQFSLPPITYAGQWALEITSLLNANMYINPPGGRSLFHPSELRERGIRLAFTRVLDFAYPCAHYTFEPRLSILDVLMWNSPDDTRARLGRDELDFVS